MQWSALLAFLKIILTFQIAEYTNVEKGEKLHIFGIFQDQYLYNLMTFFRRWDFYSEDLHDKIPWGRYCVRAFGYGFNLYHMQDYMLMRTLYITPMFPNKSE